MLVSREHMEMKAKHLAILLFLVLLTSCIPPTAEPIPPGLRAINPEKGKAILVEYIGDPPAWRLVLLDLTSFDTSEITTKDVSINEWSRILLSPNAKFIAFDSPSGWYLQSLEDGTQKKLAESGEIIEFLPDNRILIWLYADVYSEVAYYSEQFIDRLAVVDPQDLYQQEDFHRKVVHSNILFKLEGNHNSYIKETQTPSKSWILINDDLIVTTTTFYSAMNVSDSISYQMHPSLQAKITSVREEIDILWDMGKKEAGEDFETELQDEKNSISPDMTDEQYKEYDFRRYYSDLISADVSLSEQKHLFLFKEFSFLNYTQPTSYSLYLVEFDDLTEINKRVLSSETSWKPFFSFSPDGEQILFESSHYLTPDADDEYNLYLSDLNSGGIERFDLRKQPMNIQWHE